MGWWSRAVSRVKSAVNKAVSSVKRVVSSVKRTVSNTVKKVSSAVSRVVSSVKSSVSSTVKKASSAVSGVVNTIKKTVSNVVEKVKDGVAAVTDTVKNTVTNQVGNITSRVEDIKGAIKEKAEETLEKVKERVEALGWKERLADFIKDRALGRLPLGIVPQIDAVETIYAAVTGKVLTEKESIILKAKIVDWIVPLNVLSKLFFGKNLDGKPEEFGTVGDYAELVFALAIFVPVGKIGAVGTKLGIKAGTKLGLKNFIKFATTKIDDAAKLFKILNVDDQAKLLGKLSKTDDGIKVINLLLGKKALHTTLVKPTISIVNKKIAESILRKAGLLGFLPKMLRPKTIIGSIIGLSSLLGLAYGIPFGTSWLAKEGIKEQFEIPLADRMRDYRYEPTVELLEIIKDDIKKLRAALPIARTTIMRVAWLWPPTKEAWEFYADNIYFSIEQYEKELELLLPPELIEIPETVRATVRDIIDGDTIDVDLDAKDAATGREMKLPEYRETGHARIRIVGINAPEKSPKGEILCSDIEIVKVEKEFADNSRDRLLPLNDKEVILKIDPEISVDTYNRILAVVEHNGVDIGLRQIEEGLACGYYRDPHKYYDEGVYSAATLIAKNEGIGMWAGLEEVEKEEEKIRIKITSEPKNAKLYLDDVALHHNTPSDEIELSDVLHLFTLGPHVLSAEKAGLSVMEDIEIIKGDNGTIHLTLVTEPVPPITLTSSEKILYTLESSEVKEAVKGLSADFIPEIAAYVKNVVRYDKERAATIDRKRIDYVAADILRNGTGVCVDGSIVANAMLASMGIKGTIVGGYLDTEDVSVLTRIKRLLKLDRYKHAWVEFTKDGKRYILDGINNLHGTPDELRGKGYDYKKIGAISISSLIDKRLSVAEQEELPPTEEEIAEEELVKEEIEEKEIEEAVVEEVEEPVTIKEAFEDLFKRGLDLAVKIYTPIKPADIPKEYTNEQSWALNEAFAKVLELTEGREVMSRKEKADFIEMFSMHTDGQKEVLNLLIKDVLILTSGRNQLSADEYIELKEKYRMT